MKIFLRLMALCLTVALVFVLSGFNADENNAAVVIKDQGCLLFDGNGSLTWAESTIQVITFSDNVVLVCKAKKLNNDTGKAVIWDYENTGVGCLTGGGLTYDWQNVVSASGNATLACRVKLNDD